ncbi:hypothetical protein FQN57_007206 [Myotisia sp. PD_48]|nr:hypothetical protein FQN57_007206 [Myotisia sp. PD_48]
MDPGHNEYFIREQGISREIIQRDICRYLGNDALVRNVVREGVPGYFIRAYRNLTTEMIIDLQKASADFEARRAAHTARGGTNYEEAGIPPSSNSRYPSYETSSTQPPRPQPPYQPDTYDLPPSGHQSTSQTPPYYAGYPGQPPPMRPSYPPASSVTPDYTHGGNPAYPYYPPTGQSSGATLPRFSGQSYEGDRDHSPVGHSAYTPSSGADPRTMDPGYPVESSYNSRPSNPPQPRNNNPYR